MQALPDPVADFFFGFSLALILILFLLSMQSLAGSLLGA